MISISTYMLWFYELYFIFVIDRNLLKCSSNPSNFKSCKIWTSMNCQYYSIIDWVWRQRMICCPWRQKYCQSPKAEGNISVRVPDKSYITLIPLNNCIIVKHFTTDTCMILSSSQQFMSKSQPVISVLSRSNEYKLPVHFNLINM